MSVENVRLKILREALKLFADKGYAGVSIGEIAEACDMKTPNLYKYFSGKEEIFESIKKETEAAYSNHKGVGAGSMVWIHNAKEFKEFTMHFIKQTMENQDAQNARKFCTVEQYHDDSLKGILSEKQYVAICKQYEEIFAGLIELGAIEDTDPEMLALEYSCPGTIILQECDRYPERKDELLARLEKFVDYFIEKTFN